MSKKWIPQRKILFCAVLGLLLGGCAHHLRPMANDHTIVVPGRSTAGLNQNDARRNTLVAAARLTLDHGYRYFRIAGVDNAAAWPLRPGQAVTINVFRNGEVNAHGPGIWDAQTIGAGVLPQ
jgi:hypothetical protein